MQIYLQESINFPDWFVKNKINEQHISKKDPIITCKSFFFFPRKTLDLCFFFFIQINVNSKMVHIRKTGTISCLVASVDSLLNSNCAELVCEHYPISPGWSFFHKLHIKVSWCRSFQVFRNFNPEEQGSTDATQCGHFQSRDELLLQKYVLHHDVFWQWIF